MDSTSSEIRANGKTRRNRTVCDSAAAANLRCAERLANVGQLAAGLAHEINTPLGAISAHAEESLVVLDHLRDGRLSSRTRQDLRGRLMAIMRQANRCSRITTRLLQFAQPRRARGETCRSQQVIDEVMALLAPAAIRKGVRLERTVAPSLSDVPLGPAELEQILVHLVQNSLDACERGDVVTIQADMEAGQLRFIVVDTGCGITPDVLRRVFDPFFTTKPVGQGTGLGLSVCHGIARSVGGCIEIESAAGHGTQVTVRLPVQAAHVTGMPEAETAARP